VLRRPVGLDQANIDIEGALRDRRAKIHGQRQRFAGPLRVIDQCPQDGGGGCSAEWADEGPVIVTGLSSPAAVTGSNPCGVVEKVLGFCKHRLFRIPSFRVRCYASPRNDGTVLHAQYRGNSVECSDAGGNGFPLTG
jgi:hypothetical protein